MNKTAIIYSEEEALAMLPPNRPMCYRVPGNIYHDCFVAVGGGSMCWTGMPQGTFDAEKAERITLDLLFSIAKELEVAGMVYEKWPDAWKGKEASK